MAESIATTLRALALALALGAGLASSPLQAKEAAPVAANEQIEARMMAVANELRCLVCQNQTIADSHADLAVDLRQQIREMIAKGDSNRQILDYMTERYGDFVLYRPPFKATTALLWAGPAVLLIGAMGVLFIVLRRRSRLGADAYDPDTTEVIR
jgi:cytochrome c-type biogenesis protein CcmH